MNTVLRRWRLRLTGPAGRRLLLALAVVAAWLAWMLVPPQPLVAWTASAEPIWEVVLSPDGTRLLCHSREKITSGPESLRLLDAATGHEVMCLQGLHLDGSDRSRFSPDGRWVISHVRPAAILIHDVADGRLRHRIVPFGGRDLPSSRVWDLQVTLDGRTLAFCDNARPEVQLWDLESGRLKATLAGVTPPMAFSPDGRTLAARLYLANASNSPETSLRLWDTTTGRDMTFLQTPPHDHIGSVAFSPDGRWLAVRTREREERIGIWDLSTGRLRTRLQPVAFHSRLRFSSDGRFLVSGEPGSIVVWDLTAAPPRCIDHLLAKASWSPYGDVFPFPVFDQLGRRLVVPGRREETLAVFDALRLERIAELPGGGHFHNLFALAPNGRFLAVHERSMPQWWEAKLEDWVGRPLPWKGADRDECYVRFYDLETGASCGRVPAGHSFDSPVICSIDSPARNDTDTLIGFGPDGRSLWVYRQNWGERGRPSPCHVRCWAVPSPWPPAWLLGVTALGVLLAVVDGWRARQRRTSFVRP